MERIPDVTIEEGVSPSFSPDSMLGGNGIGKVEELSPRTRAAIIIVLALSGGLLEACGGGGGSGERTMSPQYRSVRSSDAYAPIPPSEPAASIGGLRADMKPIRPEQTQSPVVVVDGNN